MHENTEFTLTRDCEAIQIPSGNKTMIPAGTQGGQKFRLRGHGLPNVGKADERGDLYARVEVEIPKSLSAEERTHYESLNKLIGDSR